MPFISNVMGFLKENADIIVFYTVWIYIISLDINSLNGEIYNPLAAINFCTNQNNPDLFGIRLGSVNLSLLGVFLLVTAISLAFYSLIWMLGKVLDKKEFINFSKFEMVEVGTTIFVGILILALTHLNCILTGVADDKGTSANYYSLGYYFYQLNERVLEYLDIMTSILYTRLDMLKVTTYIWGTSSRFVSGLIETIEPSLQNASIALGLAIMLNKFLTLSYDFLTYSAVVFLLPIAMVLRNFYPTRNIGGALMGIILGGNLLLPIYSGAMHGLLLSYKPIAITLDITSTTNHVAGHTKFNPALSIIPIPNAEVAKEDISKIEVLTYPIAPGGVIEKPGDESYMERAWEHIKNGGGIFSLIISITLDLIKGAFSILFKLIYYVVFEVVVFTVLNGIFLVMVVGQGTRISSAILGEEIDITNLTRLI